MATQNSKLSRRDYIETILLCSLSLLLCMLTACTNHSNKDKNDASTIAEYYKSTPAPPYIVERFGPFGPQEKSYPVPAGAVIVAHDGLDANDGSSIDKPTTLEKAINNAVTGTVIVLRGGVYRTGNLVFNKKITIQPYLKERPVIKGSKIASEWVKRDDYWVTKWDSLFRKDLPKYIKPDTTGPPLPSDGDLVMVNGKMYLPVGQPSDLDSGKFYCDYAANEVYISEDPEDKTIEIAAHKYGFVRKHDKTADTEGPTILGLDIIQYAFSCIQIQGDDPYRPIESGEMPNAPIKTRIENCRILFCPRTGLSIISPDSYIAYNDISMIGSVAMTIRMSHNTIFEHNIISNSDWFKTKGFPAGIKVFNQAYNFTVRNNYLSDMPCVAVWYDVGHREGVVVDNYFNNCRVGLKIEISHRTYIAGNVFNKTRLWLCNSNNCLVFNNTLIDSRIDLWRNNRGYGGDWNRNFSFNHAATGPGPLGYHGHHVANNVFAGQPPDGYYFLIEDNGNFGEEIYDKNFQSEVLAHNLFLHEAEWTFNAEYQPKKLTAVKFASLTDFRKDYSDFEEGNVQLDITQEKLFMSKDNGDFRLRSVPGLPGGLKLPESIARLLGWNPAKQGLGAFAQ